jgi:hypothetical protein
MQGKRSYSEVVSGINSKAGVANVAHVQVANPNAANAADKVKEEAARNLVKLDQKYAQQMNSMKQEIEALKKNQTADKWNGKFPKFDELPRYKGKYVYNPAKFLEDCQTIAEKIYRVPEENLQIAVLTAFPPNSVDWNRVNRLINATKSWQEFQEDFVAAFSGPTSKADAHERFHAMKMGPKQSVEEFFEEFLQAAEATGREIECSTTDGV